MLSFVFLSVFITNVKAQFQEEKFSGNDKNSYQCFKNNGQNGTVSDVKLNGYWLCKCEDESDPNPNGRCGSSTTCPAGSKPGSEGCFAQQAVLKPPKLQQLEIWFVRIIYVVWSLVGTLSFLFLIVLGYRYTISRGDVTKITEIRQKIIYYIIGLALVFLAVPILTTVFRVMGINKDVECYNVNMPGFQFFFADLCTDPNGSVTDPCDASDILDDIRRGVTGDTRLACSQRGQTKSCPGIGSALVKFCCTNSQVWAVIPSVSTCQ